MPPVVYLEQIPEPPFTGQTNRDLLNWALKLRNALRLANQDKKSLADWATNSSADLDNLSILPQSPP